MDAVYDFDLDRENARIYSAGSDGYIVQWTAESEEGVLILQTDEAFYSIFYEEEAKRIYAGTKSGEVYSVDLVSSSLLSNAKVHSGGVFFISQWQTFLLSGGEDGVLRIGERSLTLSKSSLRCSCHSKEELFIGSSDGNIYVLNRDFEVIKTMSGHTNSVFGLSLVDNEYLVSTGRDALIKMWDLKSYREILSVPAHNYQGKSLSFNGEYLLSSSMDKTIKIWTKELELLKVMDYSRNQSHINCINKVIWLNQEQFVSCSDDRSLILWQMEIN